VISQLVWRTERTEHKISGGALDLTAYGLVRAVKIEHRNGNAASPLELLSSAQASPTVGDDDQRVGISPEDEAVSFED
jgi:hypothetical protein